MTLTDPLTHPSRDEGVTHPSRTLTQNLKPQFTGSRSPSRTLTHRGSHAPPSFKRRGSVTLPPETETPMANPHHTDYLYGDVDFETLATHYRCGHCNSTTSLGTDSTTGLPDVCIHHDDGCPVLNGTLPSTPDVLRALVGHVPDTFRP